MIKGEGRFQWPDYLVFTLSLLISAAIGIYYHLRSRSSTDEYLMGSRNMGILPVAASLVVTGISAIAVLGVPAETYAYGVQIALFNVGLTMAMVIACIFFMPVYHRLKITSLYEYLEMRFDHRVRTLCSILALIQMILYSSVALYAPAIAISAVTGMPYWACILISSVLVTFYTTLGGYKTVLWTDTVQASIMFLGLVATFGKGLVDAGGWNRVMNISTLGGRMDMGTTEFDPFARHNMWAFIFGDLPFCLALYGVGQFAVQRFCSIRNINKARISLFIVAPVVAVFSLLSMTTGFIAFAFYYGCDPLYSGKIETRDQTLPVLVMDVFHAAPGMAGLFLSSVLSAALSTLSSVQNSFAAVLLEDGVKPLAIRVTGRPLSDRAGTIISKIIVFTIGAIILGLAMGAANMGKLLFQMSATFIALGSGPSLGCFCLGLFIPFANSIGALAGCLVGVSLLAWISFGALGQPKIHQALPTFNHLCPENNETFTNMIVSAAVSNMTTVGNGSLLDTGYALSEGSSWDSLSTNMSSTTMATGHEDVSNVFILYRISFRYFVFLGAVPTILIGCLVSLLSGGWKQRHKVPKKVLFNWRSHGIHCKWEDEEDEDDKDIKDTKPDVMNAENSLGPIHKYGYEEKRDHEVKEHLMQNNSDNELKS